MSRLLNPNDIFSQIGFIMDASVSSPSKQYKNSKYNSNKSLTNSVHPSYNQNYNNNNNNQKPSLLPYYEQQFKQTDYITSLQIQLSQNQNHLLQIKSYDDPYQLAVWFCNLHNLNKLAVQIVQKKIIQAKQKQLIKIKNNIIKKSNYTSNNRKSIQQNQQSVQQSRKQSPMKNYSIYHENQLFGTQTKNQQQSSYQDNKSRTTLNNRHQHKQHNRFIEGKYLQIKNKSKQHQNVERSKSFIKSQSNINQINQRKKSINNYNNESNNHINNNNNNNNNIKNNHNRNRSSIQKACQNLYFRGLMQTKAIQEKRLKRQQQKQQKQQQQLTFKPKINLVSQKIIQFRRQTGTVKPQNKKKQVCEKLFDQLKQCTFTPEINKISKIIVHNRQAYRTQNQHFNQVFNNTNSISNNNELDKNNPITFEQRSSSVSKISTLSNKNHKKSRQFLQQQHELQQQKLFKPKLNPKSIQKVKQSFFTRLQKAIQNKQKIKQGQYKNDEYTFQPKIGRSPYFNSRQSHIKGKQNIPVWQQLYKQSKIRAQKIKKQQQKRKKQQKQHGLPINKQPQQFLNHSQTSKTALSMNKASSNIYYQNLIQKRITHVFQLLDSDYDKIISPEKISIENLSKNVLIFLRPIFEEMDQLNAELNFNQFKKAVINLLNDSDPYKKGLFLSDNHKIVDKQCTFVPSINEKSKQLAQGKSNNIHQQLYHQGVKSIQKKQFYLQKERAKKQQQLLSQCSFKPCLKLANKSYQPHIFNKKIEELRLKSQNQQNQLNQSNKYENYSDQHNESMN